MKRTLITMLAGAILAGIVVGAGAFFFLRLGFLDMRADIRPSALESRLAMACMDASCARHAPDVRNPVQPTNANLLAGMRLYRHNCAMCHGAPDHPERRFGHPLYPPAPHFMDDPADMPENQNFHIIRRGVRWTGMPAWRDTLNDTQIWQVVTFLKRMDSLPPTVKTEWEKSAAAVAGAPAPVASQPASPHGPAGHAPRSSHGMPGM